MKTAIVIGGPTASGKSSLAVSLATAVNGTVINADSLQIYNDLPILTAQPGAEERELVPHDLYGVTHPDNGYTAQDWRLAALAAMERSAAQNRTPVIVGGTGFYINALLQGMSAIPDIPASARAEAQKLYENGGLDALTAPLMHADPEGTARIDAKNPQRLMRAYEVMLHTGRPISYWQAQPRQGPPQGWRFLTVALLPPRDTIRRNCDARIALMLEAGMLEEVATFAARIRSGDVSADCPLTHACGYAPLARHIAGDMVLTNALEEMRIDTRQYARRQETWFRRQWQPDMEVQAAEDPAVLRAAEALLARPAP